mgnify:CR=1 FL=1
MTRTGLHFGTPKTVVWHAVEGLKLVPSNHDTLLSSTGWLKATAGCCQQTVTLAHTTDCAMSYSATSPFTTCSPDSILAQSNGCDQTAHHMADIILRPATLLTLLHDLLYVESSQQQLRPNEGAVAAATAVLLLQCNMLKHSNCLKSRRSTPAQSALHSTGSGHQPSTRQQIHCGHQGRTNS